MIACRKETERNLTGLKQQTKQLETWIASRTKWPSKVNETCQAFRDQRIGIDLVMDKVEIQLGRERDMLMTTATDKPYTRLDEAYATEAQLQALLVELDDDIRRKASLFFPT
jgi:hypothetical protein